MKKKNFIVIIALATLISSCSNDSSSKKYKLFFNTYFDTPGVSRLVEYNPDTDETKIIGGDTVEIAYGRKTPVNHNSKVYFRAYTPSDGLSLWVYDPSKSEQVDINPKVLTDLRPLSSASASPDYLYSVGESLVFTADTDASGNELFIYEDSKPISSSNPQLIDLNPSGSSDPEGFLQVDEKIYFIFNNGSENALGVYDSSIAISASNPSTLFTGYIIDKSAVSIQRLFLLIQGDKLYFPGNNGSLGNELMVFNLSQPQSGSNPSVELDINTGANNSNANHFVSYQDKIYFFATNGTDGYELWSYNPSLPSSASNPEMHEIYIGSSSSISANFNQLEIQSSKLFFAASDIVVGRELWIWDLNENFNKGTNPKLYEFRSTTQAGDGGGYTKCLNTKFCFNTYSEIDSIYKLRIYDGGSGLPEISDFKTIEIPGGEDPGNFSTFVY